MLEYPGPAVVRLLGSIGNILLYLLLILFLCECLGVCDWFYYKYRL